MSKLYINIFQTLFVPLIKWTLSFLRSKPLKYNDPGHYKTLSNSSTKL